MPVGLTMKYDPDLYERNLQCLEQQQPALVGLLRSLENIATKVVEDEDGGLNLDLGHTRFYERDAETFAKDQLKHYWEHPDRIDVSGAGLGVTKEKRDIDSTRSLAERMLLLSRNWMTENGLVGKFELKDADAGFLFILGIGLGCHVDSLLEDAQVQHIVIVEQFPEFLYHCLHLHDLSDWYTSVEAKGGSLMFLLGDDPSFLTTNLYSIVKFKAFEITDGSYFYVHYNSYFLKQVEREFREKISLITANPGFFEDEIKMLSNCFRNITSYDHLTFVVKTRLEKETPIVIVGSGPSLDTSIGLIKENRDKIIVLSCGTGLGSLLGHGVTPDFHAELENTPGPLEVVGNLSKQYDLSPITLIASNTINPELPKLFKRRILFFRDSVTSTYAFGGPYGAVYNAAPTVTNAGARLAVGLGFRKLYLVGVDLGSREKGKHHSAQSVYVADKNFLATHPGHKAASNFKHQARGNFGGTIQTNQSFLWSSTMFQALKEYDDNVELVNCSDGIRISGATPQLPETVQFKTSVARRNRELAMLIQEHDEGAGRLPINVSDMEKIDRKMAAFYGGIENALDGFSPSKADFFKLYEVLRELTYKSDKDNSVESRVVRQFHIGTVMMFIQIAHIILRRLPENVRPGYLEFFRDQFEAFLSEMREKGLECTGGILKQAKELSQ
ncbi:motility associated factor glycosyltransferase family protein [Aestuariispira ectoiniformans]|uniref:motility associated factor glycosyltransferase family protein n=1 Tax=Aestuariispira ectoiniformans TaxID=2775080 RepID=UPI00223B2251|nr:6-hydroxymethylpterin diphosphokinase MptE-like protein [Aestuariispira ectoiniformans]